MSNLFGEEQPQTDGKKARYERKKFDEPASFEQAFAELEAIVKSLDSQDMPLEQTIDIFERAQFLAKWCTTALDRFEGKLKFLVSTPDGLQLEEE